MTAVSKKTHGKVMIMKGVAFYSSPCNDVLTANIVGILVLTWVMSQESEGVILLLVAKLVYILCLVM